MVEYTGHIEAHDTVACAAVYGWYRVAVRRPDRGNAMAGIATEVRNNGRGMVGECIQETCSRMTGYAVRVGDRMSAGRDVGCSRCLAYGRNAIVTARTTTRYARVIKLAVRAKLEKTGGIVAVVALGAGR